MSDKPQLTPVKIFWFYLPLAAMWLTMGIEQPLVTALMARLPEPRENLASFGITFSLALIIESPIVMLLTASTALAHHRKNYKRLLLFTHLLVFGVTAVHLLVATRPVFWFVATRIIGAPPQIVAAGNRAFWLMTPWSAAVAYRRLWEGVLIRFRKTAVIPVTMGLRLLVSSLVMLIGYLFKQPGAELGSLALSCGVITAAIVASLFVRPVVKTMPSGSGQAPISWSHLIRFYAPLALSILLIFVRRPILSMGLARAADPLASLAIWPVLTGVLFLVSSMAIASQEVVITLIDEQNGFPALRRFTHWLCLSLTALLALFSFSPLSAIWFLKVVGLESSLIGMTRLPMILLFIVPGLETILAWNRGLLVHANRTQVISQAVGLNLVFLVLIMFGGMRLTSWSGAALAAIATSGALLVEILFLGRRRMALQSGNGGDVKSRRDSLPTD